MKTLAGLIRGRRVRHEIKHLVSEEKVHAIRKWMRLFMVPDENSARMADLRYPVSTLYLDTRDLALYRATAEGQRNRFKLRIRLYNARPDDPAFFEVKKRANTQVYKRRALMARGAVDEIISGQPVRTEHLVRRGFSDFEEFVDLNRGLEAYPVVWARYMREAWESPDADSVRITFDTALNYAAVYAQPVGLATGRWHDIGLRETVLEIKFSDSCPGWVFAMARELNLQQMPVPKYLLAYDAAAAAGRQDTEMTWTV